MPLTAFGDEISPDLDEQLAELRVHGIVGLDLRTAFGKNVSQLTDDDVDCVAETCERHGVPVHALGSPVNKVRFTPDTPQEELDKLARIAAIAKRLGVRRIRIFSPETDGQEGGAGWGDVVATLRPQVELAASEDLVLMHENDGTYFGAFPGNCQRLLAEFGGPHFRAVYDPGNAQMIGSSTMGDWFPWLLPYLVTIHVKDAVRATRQFVYAGQGDGQFLELMTFLSANRWSGPMTIEPHANMHATGGYLSGRKNFADAVAAIRSVADQAGFTL